MTDSESTFELITAAADDSRRVRHALVELPALEAELDEMLARQSAQANPLAVTADRLEAMTPKIWENYRKGGRGTPTPASTLTAQAIDRAEIERRLGAR